MDKGSRRERSLQTEGAAYTRDGRKHGLFGKLRDVLDGQVVQKQGGIIFQ